MMDARVKSNSLAVVISIVLWFLVIPGAVLYYSVGPGRDHVPLYKSFGVEPSDHSQTKASENSLSAGSIRVAFNISFLKASCDQIHVDTSGLLGLEHLSLDKTPIAADTDDARSTQQARSGRGSHESSERDVAAAGRSRMATHVEAESPQEFEDVRVAGTNYTAHLTQAQLSVAKKTYPILVVNFYAPWCPWCQRLAPVWDSVMDYARTRYPASDGRVRVGRVDCTVETDMCNEEVITGFPSIRIYRGGSDDVVVRGRHMHEGYKGDRTEAALKAFIDKLAASAGPPPEHPAVHVDRVEAAADAEDSEEEEEADVAAGFVHDMHGDRVEVAAAADVFEEEGDVAVRLPQAPAAAGHIEAEHVGAEKLASVGGTAPLTAQEFHAAKQKYPIVMVNFCVSWSAWCQRMAPAWQAAEAHARETYPPADRRILVAHIDCSASTAEQNLCRHELVTSYPTMWVYRNTMDEYDVSPRTHQERYLGDLTEAAFKAFIDDLVASADPKTRATMQAKLTKPIIAAQEGVAAVGTAVSEHGADFVGVDSASTEYTSLMTAAEFQAAKQTYPLLVVDFYAAWCPWSKKLLPVWMNVMEHARTAYPASDGRLRVARVDCTLETDLCNKEVITGFPTMRIYRGGSDETAASGLTQREQYRGDRTEEAITAFIDNLVASTSPRPARTAMRASLHTISIVAHEEGVASLDVDFDDGAADDGQSDDAFEDVKVAGTNYTALMTAEQFRVAKQAHPLLLVNFYSRLCPWSRRLLPVWMELMEYARTAYPASDGRIRVARAEIISEPDLFEDEAIMAFPTMRVYNGGSGASTAHSTRGYEEYRGDRTLPALKAFVDRLVASAAPAATQVFRAPYVVPMPIVELGALGNVIRGNSRATLATATVQDSTVDATTYTAPMNAAQFRAAQQAYPLLLVNFYAPWCPVCTQLAPAWEAAMNHVRTTYPASGGRVRVTSVDCTRERALCEAQAVSMYPSVRVYRRISDAPRGAWETYRGEHSPEALIAFIGSLDPELRENPESETRPDLQGCMVTGSVTAQRAPGTLSFGVAPAGAAAPGARSDVSHRVNAFAVKAAADPATHTPARRRAYSWAAFPEDSLGGGDTTQYYLIVLPPDASSASSGGGGLSDMDRAFPVGLRDTETEPGAVPAVNFSLQN